MTDYKKLIEETLRLDSEATAGPWAWEQYGEKENCYHVGVAYSVEGQPLSGQIQSEVYDEHCDAFVEVVIWKDSVGQAEGAVVNYSDASAIAHNRTAAPLLAEKLRAVLDLLERAVDWVDNAHCRSCVLGGEFMGITRVQCDHCDREQILADYNRAKGE